MLFRKRTVTTLGPAFVNLLSSGVQQPALMFTPPAAPVNYEDLMKIPKQSGFRVLSIAFFTVICREGHYFSQIPVYRPMERLSSLIGNLIRFGKSKFAILTGMPALRWGIDWCVPRLTKPACHKCAEVLWFDASDRNHDHLLSRNREAGVGAMILVESRDTHHPRIPFFPGETPGLSPGRKVNNLNQNFT